MIGPLLDPRPLTERDLADRYRDAVSDSRAGDQVAALGDRLRPVLADTGFLGQALSRPAFASQVAIEQLGVDLASLHTALTGLPDRLFGGDLAAFARAVGATSGQADIVLRGSRQQPSRMGRADFYRDDQGFRLLEINWGGALGGLDSAILNRAMAEQPRIGEFLTEYQLGYVDPMAEMIATLRAECQLPTDRPPVVALADWPASFATLEPRLRRNVVDYARFGIEALPCHVGQLRYQDGRVWLAERAIDAVYRLFLMEDLLDPSGPGLIEPVLRAAERGEVALFSPMDADLYGSKGALALLSDERYRDRYQPAELASLDRILPWTRMVRPGPVTVAGRQLDLAEHAIANQAELIIKPTMMHGGQGIVAGWLTNPADWAEQLGAAMDGEFVLQRRIHPVPERFPTEDGGLSDWTLTWGAFMSINGYAGMYVRGSQQPDGTVNMSSGATGGCCFHPLATS